jgi:hypothetical protein
MTERKEPVTFFAGCAIERDYIYVGSKPDALDDDVEFARLFFFDEQNRAQPWVHHDLKEFDVVSVCVAAAVGGAPRQYCALSRQGDVEFIWVGGSRMEQIESAGVRRSTPPIYGYVQAIRQIGDELYVVGSGGQVYCRRGDGWQAIATSLQKPAVAPASVLDAAGLDIGGKEFADIDGTSSSDLYVVGGNGEIFHFDGGDWTECDSDAARPLNCVRAVSRDEVWVCGFGGSLMRGNARQGFSQVGSCSEVLTFTSLGILEGRIYLASNKGIFTLSDDGIIRRLKTSLKPEVDDANVIDVKDGMLWSFGNKDIVRFDGKQWTRLVHPDNADGDG